MGGCYKNKYENCIVYDSTLVKLSIFLLNIFVLEDWNSVNII